IPVSPNHLLRQRACRSLLRRRLYRYSIRSLEDPVPVALLALAIGAFGIGTTEFVMMGVLPLAAEDFGVSIPSAGYLISGYALGVVIGAPLLTAAGTRLPRKHMLLALMTLFTVGNLLFAI